MDLARNPPTPPAAPPAIQGSSTIARPITSTDHAQRLLICLADGAVHPRSELTALIGDDGQHLGDAMQYLTDAGLNVISNGDSHWQLEQALEVLDPIRIRDGLTPQAGALLGQLDLHFQLDSTNNHLKRLSAHDQGHDQAHQPAHQPTQDQALGHACLAEHQTAGRGRRGRHWVSPAASNLYLSLRWSYRQPLPDLDGLSLALGITAAEALADCGIPEVAVKWPNDLPWHDHKLGGILVELIRRHPGVVDVIAGLGINTRLSATNAATIDQHWTDLDRITAGHAPGRNRLAATLLDGLLLTLRQFGERGFEPWRERYPRHDSLRGRAGTLHRLDGSRRHGIARGIDARGALLVETADGIRVHQAGDVSVRTQA